MNNGSVSQITALLDVSSGLQPCATEEGVRRLLAEAQQALPECSFALAAFDETSWDMHHVLCSDKVRPDISQMFESGFPLHEFLTASGIKLDGTCVDVSASKIFQAIGTVYAMAIARKASVGPGLLVVAWRDQPFGVFRRPDLDVIEQLSHVSAAMVQLRAGSEAELQKKLGSVLDQIGIGLIVAGKNLEISYSNHNAERFLSDGQYVANVSHHLEIMDALARKRIERSIDYALQQAGDSDAAGPAIIPLRGKMTEIMLKTSLMPMLSCPLLGPARTALIMWPTGQRTSISLEKLREIGLTNAESRLTEALLQGKTVTQYAKEKNLAVATVRAHLKRVMMRLDVHRQSDLVRTLLEMF